MKTELTSNPINSLLIVDDNEMNRDLMSLQLRRNGFNPSTASGGKEALEMIARNQYDVILLDIMMPVMSGIEVLTKIRETHSILKLPVIMVTADDAQERIVECLQHGANDYLVKPLHMPVTTARINTQLHLKQLATLKDEFVQFASHDLKKPLIVLLDILSELKPQIPVGATISSENVEYIDLIEKTAQNMQSVVENFLDTKQLDSGKSELDYQPIHLNTLIRKTLDANRTYAKQKGIKLLEQLNPDLPAIEADVFRISQVLENLIGNAMKFSAENTCTVIQTHSDGDYVYAEIIDEGPGINEDDRKKLFKKNAELSNKPTGNESSSGIGLSLSKQMIDLHQGHIGATQNEDKGTTFWFSLPIKVKKAS